MISIRSLRAEGIGSVKIPCRDKHDPGEIEGEIEIVVAEGIVLFWIENLQESRGWVSTKVVADLIDLIHHEDRIIAAGLFNRLDDPSGQGTDIGPAMSSYLSLIPNSPQRNPDKFSSQGPWRSISPKKFFPPREAR